MNKTTLYKKRIKSYEKGGHKKKELNHIKKDNNKKIIKLYV